MYWGRQALKQPFDPIEATPRRGPEKRKAGKASLAQLATLSID